tara:strand:- start:128 stop:511 length:384 start_codon:yes stop_codon:yes gene_type:complete
MKDADDHFIEIKTFLDIFNEKLRFYESEISRILIQIQLENSKLKLLKKISNFYNEKLLKKKEEYINFNIQLKKIDKLICKICLENTSDCIIEPCMHYCCCIECIEKITNNKCPICRNNFTKYLKIFI